MKASITGLLLALGSAATLAQTSATEPWVRGTVAQQSATGAFVQLSSKQGGRLVAVSSPAAARVEIHEMAMQGDVMRMRAVAGLDLPAGKVVELKPGGFHLMLLDLKRPLKAGDTVPLTLVIEGAGQQRETLDIKAKVRALGTTAEHKH